MYNRESDRLTVVYSFFRKDKFLWFRRLRKFKNQEKNKVPKISWHFNKVELNFNKPKS